MFLLKIMFFDLFTLIIFKIFFRILKEINPSTMLRFPLILLLITVFSFKSLAQIDILLPPTDIEKNEVKRILSEYEKFMKATGDSALPKEKKAGATLNIVKVLQNNDVQVFYDLDSTSNEDKYFKFLTYAQKFKEKFPQTVNVTLQDVNMGKVKFDKIRRYYYIEVNAIKKFEWNKIAYKSITDSNGVPAVIRDTLKQGFNKKETFYIRFDRVNNISKNFKLFTIARTGAEPKLDPLPAVWTWWLEMDPQWKSYFREKQKLEEYPTTWALESITGQPELDISNKPFKTLEPLRKFVFLQKLICINTPITSLEPIANSTTLIELDISKTKIEKLDGIDKLTNLQILRCPGLKLKSIEPVRKLTNLVKLDISENELEDISPVADLINLKELDFSSNVKLEDITPIKNLTAMEKLSMAKVKAKTLEPLRNMVNLIVLNAFNTEVPTLEPIRNLQKIIILNIDHNPVTTLEPIKNYRFVVELSLSTSSVVDLTPIKDYINLRKLNVANTQIVTLGPAIKLEFIRELQCQMTKVPKEEVARFKKNHPGCEISYWY